MAYWPPFHSLIPSSKRYFLNFPALRKMDVTVEYCVGIVCG